MSHNWIYVLIKRDNFSGLTIYLRKNSFTEYRHLLIRYFFNWALKILSACRFLNTLVDGCKNYILHQWVFFYKYLYYDFLYEKSTAVEQVVACTLVTQRAGFDPRSGQVSWVRFLRGFSSPVRQMSGNFRSTWFPEYHLATIIILIISALLEWMS